MLEYSCKQNSTVCITFGGTEMQEENYLTHLKKMHRRERYEREVDTSF